MGYTEPKTWTNEPLIASDLNTYVSDNLRELKDPPSKVYNANEGTDLNLLSTSWADMDATADKLELTITTTGGDVLVLFRATGSVATGNNSLYLDVSVDGVAHGVTTIGAADGLQSVFFTNGLGAIEGTVMFMHWVTNLAAGAHTFRMRYKTSGGANTVTLYRGAGTANGDISLQFSVREVS